jgi:hypothetical protein
MVLIVVSRLDQPVVLLALVGDLEKARRHVRRHGRLARPGLLDDQAAERNLMRDGPGEAEQGGEGERRSEGDFTNAFHWDWSRMTDVSAAPRRGWMESWPGALSRSGGTAAGGGPRGGLASSRARSGGGRPLPAEWREQPRSGGARRRRRQHSRTAQLRHWRHSLRRECSRRGLSDPCSHPPDRPGWMDRRPMRRCPGQGNWPLRRNAAGGRGPGAAQAPAPWRGRPRGGELRKPEATPVHGRK